MRAGSRAIAIAAALASLLAPTAAVAEPSWIPDGRISGFGVDAQGRATLALRTTKGEKPLVARFTPAGALDSAFARGGILRPPVAGVGARIGVQPGGGLLVAGNNGKPSVLRRYRPDGTPDLGFGRRGKVPLEYRELERLLLQPGGGIVVLASRTCSPDSCGYLYHNLGVERYGKGGRHLHSYNLSKEAWNIDSAAVEPGGGFVIAGNDWELESVSYDRFLPSGAYKGDLRNGPKADLEGEESGIGGWALAIQADRKLVIANGPRLFRSKRDGSLDPSYGDGGIAVCSEEEGKTGWVSFTSLVLTADGKAVAAGSEKRCGLVRFLADGRPDPTFGGDGFVDVAALGLPRPMGVALQPDGGVLVVGWDPAAKVARLARFDAVGRLDPSFGLGGAASLAPPPAG